MEDVAVNPEVPCANTECGVMLPGSDTRRRARYCSSRCSRRARDLAEVERCRGLTSKPCRACDVDKPLTEYRHVWMLDCQSCLKRRRREQYEKRGGREYGYEAHIERRYGMSAAEYRKRVAEQGGRCAICGEEPEEGRRLHVDHNHSTGEVRDLLCRGCNHALGNVKDDAGLLRQMIAYLERHAAAQTS